MINLTRSVLRSEIVRQEVTGEGSNRTRTIAKANSQSGGNWFTQLLGSLGGGLAKFGGWLLAGLGFIGFSFSALMSFMQGGIGFLFNFNWNITDKEIDSILKGMRLALVGQLGETIGNSIGFLICGILPGVVLAKFNKALAAYVLKEVSEEAFDELMGNLRVLLRQTVYTLAAHAFYSLYKNTRNFIKDFFKNPNSPQSQFGRRLFGDSFNDAIKSWGAEGSKPWSFNIWIQNKIESIEDDYAQEFWENAWEGFVEGCSEAGFVLAQSLDNWFAQQRLQNNQVLGEDTALEIIPNREIPDERIIVAGAREIVKPAIVSALSHHQLIDNRDIGQWIGETVREATGKSFVEGLALKIAFRGKKKPPFRDSQRAGYTIFNVKRSALDWEKIKLACGGDNGYLWGRFLAIVKFVDPGIPNMKVYGATKAEAQDRAEAFLALADLEVAGINVTEELKEGNRRKYDQALYKETTRIYPVHCTVINRQKVLNEEQGRATLSGAYKERKFRLNLWTDTKPDNWDEVIRELTTTRGPNG
ncbi:hypothetical protein V0288_09195 [Pannus brasiliensis CCIBt3594]|uniref:Uncharacterized protein n=1 Tax=Pannus brasiliensis CCIBt3594 TaxID=1427578 RepID=A0AAW9QJL4_9CHRO